MKNKPFRYIFIILSMMAIIILPGCSPAAKTAVIPTSSLTSLRLELPTITPQPSPSPTSPVLLERPTVEPGARPTMDPVKLTPAVQPSTPLTLTAKNVVGVSFNDAGDKLIVVQTDGVYLYTTQKLSLDKKYDTSHLRTDPHYLGSTDIVSMDTSPNREWMALGQWWHYTSAKGNVQRGVITVLQLGNGLSKILGLDQNPASMAAPFSDVRYTPDSLSVAGEIDLNSGEVQVWETKGNLLYTLTVFHGLKSLDFSPVDKQLAMCSMNGNVEIHDTKTGNLINSLGNFTQNVSQASCGLAYSHNGAMLVFYGDDQVINLWEIGSNILIHLPGQNTSLNQIIFSPDDQSIATLGSDGLVRVWSIPGHRELFQWYDPKIGIVWIKYSPDGRFLLGEGSDGQIRIFSPQTDRLAGLIIGTGVAFSPDGKLMASYNANGQVWLWPMASFNVSQ